MILKSHKNRFWLATIFITLISIVDYQLFANWGHQLIVPHAIKGMMHVFCLFIIMATGRRVWKLYDEHGWIKKAWTYLYAAVILFTVVAGITYLLKLMSHDMLATIGFIRPFFCSPMPMFVMYILTKVHNMACL